MIAGCVIEPCQTAVGLQPSAHMRSACASSATAALWPCAWLLVAAPRHSVAPMRAAPFVSVQESRVTHGACCLCFKSPLSGMATASHCTHRLVHCLRSHVRRPTENTSLQLDNGSTHHPRHAHMYAPVPSRISIAHTQP